MIWRDNCILISVYVHFESYILELFFIYMQQCAKDSFHFFLHQSSYILIISINKKKEKNIVNLLINGHPGNLFSVFLCFIMVWVCVMQKLNYLIQKMNWPSQNVCHYFWRVLLWLQVDILFDFFCQIRTLIKVCVAFVFGHQIL